LPCLCVLFLDLSSCCVPGFVSAFGFLRNFTRSSSTLVSALELQLFALLLYRQRPCAINSLQCYRRTHRWSRFFSTSFCLSTQVLALYNARFRLALCWAPLALAVQQVLQQVPGPALFFCSWCFSSTSCSVPIAVCTSVNLYVPFVYNKNGPASVIHLSVLLLFVGLNIQGCLAVNIDNLVL